MPVSRLIIAIYTLVMSIAVVLLGRVAGESLSWSVTAAAWGLVMLVGTWLGLDLSSAYSRSIAMPKGKAEFIDTSRYILSFIALAIMAAAVVAGTIHKAVNDEAIAAIVLAIAMVGSYWIASRKTLKKAEALGNDIPKEPDTLPSGGCGGRCASCSCVGSSSASEVQQPANTTCEGA